MTNVYIVRNFHDQDHGIKEVFSDETDAKRFVEDLKHGWNDYEIVEQTLRTHKNPPSLRTVFEFDYRTLELKSSFNVTVDEDYYTDGVCNPLRGTSYTVTTIIDRKSDVEKMYLKALNKAKKLKAEFESNHDIQTGDK